MRILIAVFIVLLVVPATGNAQTAGSGFTLTTTSPSNLGGSGFNNDDNAAGPHIVTQRADTGARFDLDNDGSYEVIVLSKNAADDIHIFENTAADTYTKVWGIDIDGGTTSQVPTGVAIGDSDGDGNLEVIYVSFSAGVLRIFEMAAGQVSDGVNPSDTPMLNLSITSPSGVTVGNLDGDAFMDILIASREETAGFVIVEATGNNAYAAPVSTAVGNDDPSVGVDDGGATGISGVFDLDGDSTLEVVLAPDRQARVLDAFFIFTWDGSTFTEEARLPIATGTLGINNVLVYDLDQSGNPEIILSENGNDRVYVYESTAANTYAADAGTSGILSYTNMNPHHMAAGDRDADGAYEIYIAIDDDSDANAAEVIYYEHTGGVGAFGSGNFSTAMDLVTQIGGAGGGSNDPRDVAYAQGSLDGDTRADLFVTNQQGDFLSLESLTDGSQVPVELVSFSVR